MENGLDALKNAPKKVVHKAAEETIEFIGNKIPDKIVSPWWEFKKVWRNNYSTGKGKRNIE